MKILHVLDHSIPVHSGYAFRTRAILAHQRARGWQTAQLTGAKHPGPPSATEETVDGLRFYRTPRPPGDGVRDVPLLGQWSVVESLARRIHAVVAAEHPDVIHAHSPALDGLAALRAGRRLGIPVVYECRAFWEDAAVDHGTSREGGVRYRLTRALETHVFRHADAVTTICEGLRRDIVARAAGTPVTVVPNAVDAERFTAARRRDAALAERLGVAGRLVLGFIGSFYAYEGLSLLLGGLARLRAHVPETRLLLVGGGPQAEQLQAQARSLGVADAVVFTGRVPHDEVERYYDLVDVFVYPRFSIRLTELVTPLKPLEAMAKGRIVVASDIGGHRELITPGETGFLFPAGSEEALAACVRDVLARRAEWPDIAAAARAGVLEARTWPLSVARYEEAYAQACARRAA